MDFVKTASLQSYGVYFAARPNSSGHLGKPHPSIIRPVSARGYVAKALLVSFPDPCASRGQWAMGRSSAKSRICYLGEGASDSIYSSIELLSLLHPATCKCPLLPVCSRTWLEFVPIASAVANCRSQRSPTSCFQSLMVQDTSSSITGSNYFR